MMSVTPCSRSRASWYARNGRPRSGTTGFARASVSGRSRVPWPPARMTAWVAVVYVPGDQGWASLISITGMSSRIG